MQEDDTVHAALNRSLTAIWTRSERTQSQGERDRVGSEHIQGHGGPSMEEHSIDNSQVEPKRLCAPAYVRGDKVAGVKNDCELLVMPCDDSNTKTQITPGETTSLEWAGPDMPQPIHHVDPPSRHT